METTLLTVIELVAEAAIAPRLWPETLKRMAVLAGGWGGQLVGVSRGELVLNFSGAPPDAVLTEFAERGGPDPAINLHAAGLVTAKPGLMAAESNVAPVTGRQCHPVYNEFLERADAPFASLAVVDVDHDLKLVAAVLRSEDQGAGQPHQQAALMALLPHLRTAARLHLRLDAQAGHIAMKAMDQMHIRAIMCDSAGRIVRSTPQAESLLANGDLLIERGGCLTAVNPQSDLDLHAAISSVGASKPASPAPVIVTLLSNSSLHLATAEVFPLTPERNSFGMSGQVMVVVGRAIPGSSEALVARFGLTGAEAEIMRGLADGKSPADLAADRGVSITTVRTQIRSLFSKMDVKKLTELIVKVRGYV